MPTFGQPDFGALDRAADTLEANAGDLRAQVARLQSGAASVQWQSPAATAFRNRNDEVCAALRQCAAELEHAGHELRRHASAAREHLRVLTAPVAIAGELAGGAVDAVGDVAGDLVGVFS